MNSLYFSDKSQEVLTIFQSHYNKDVVDLLVHAMFTSELECVDLEVREQSARTLETMCKMGIPSTLSSLEVGGPPILAHCGYNGYTAKEPFVQGDYSFQVDFKNQDVLMGSAFVGSSGNVYTPTLVASQNSSFQNTGMKSDELSRLLMYDQGKLIEARYNVVRAEFEIVQSGKSFDPKQVMIRSNVQGHSKYIRDRELMEMPFKFKNEGSYPDGFTFVPDSIPNLFKHIGRSIGFVGWE